MNKLIISFFFLYSLIFPEEGVFYIRGEAIKSISLSLGISSINFGDVLSGQDVDEIPVNFYVNGDANYPYEVEVKNDDTSGVLEISKNPTSGYTKGSLNYTTIATGMDQTHEFYVNLDTKNMVGDLYATITIVVAYLEIAE